MPRSTPLTPLIRGLLRKYPDPDVMISLGVDEHDQPCQSTRHAYLGERVYNTHVRTLCGSEVTTGSPPTDPDGHAALCWAHGRTCRECARAMWWLRYRLPHPTYG